MTGAAALIANLAAPAIAWLLTGAAFLQFRERRRRDDVALLALVATVALGATGHFGVHASCYANTRLMMPDKIDAISIDGFEITSAIDRDRIVAALARSEWYYRSGSLAQPLPLVIRFDTNEQVTWQIFYDNRQEGAVVYFYDGRGLNPGAVFSAELASIVVGAGVPLVTR